MSFASASGTSATTKRLSPKGKWSGRELSMPATNTEIPTRDRTDEAARIRLQEDVTAVKNDIAALTEQITDVLNSFSGAARRQAQHGYQRARAGAEDTLDDMSERGSAMMDAAQDAAASLEETLEDAITQRPLAAMGLALGVGFLVGVAWRR
jgi:ElaB/YqjD/DUF883 family membrane-anchored ribosome-binding protein